MVHVGDEGNGVDGVEAATRGPQVLEDGSWMSFSVIRGCVFERAYVSIVDYTEDELVRGAYRGVVEEVVLDARFMDGFCARANDGLGVVRDGRCRRLRAW